MSFRKIIPVLLALMILLSGCGQNREKECLRTAEEYLPALSKAVGDDLTLDGSSAEQTGDGYAFSVRSAKYSDGFLVYVRQDGSVTDTYFSLSLLESAQKECAEILSSALPDYDGTASAAIERRLISSALSKRLFDSVYDAQETAPAAVLLKIELLPGEKTLAEEDITALLREILDRGLSASVSVSGAEASYEVSDGCMYRLSPGADGGAYVKKTQLP